MEKVIFTQELISQVLRLLYTKTPFKKESISYEIQDEFKLLFITIAIDEFPEAEHVSTFKDAAILLNEMIPGRSGDDSWMVAFTRAGKVVDSYFGGNLSSPNYGL